MKKLYPLIIMCLALCIACTQTETDPECVAMRGLVNRVVPEYSKNIVLERLETDSALFADGATACEDRFELESKGDRKSVV